MDFPVLAEYVNDNNIAVSTKEDLVSILLNIPTHYNSPIYCSPIYYYFSVLSHRCSTDSRAKAELVKVFSMAPGNESLTDLLLMHLIKGGGHNDEQFIHRV
ncbi:hypothetical protein KA013_03160 [Patescibacteria group bacterium]|nr:hypothetical protein [Patescibacteria group bacterium]